MKTLRFGIEIETVGQTRAKVARAIQRVVGGNAFHHGGGYDAWHVTDSRGRTWKVVRDASLSGRPGSRKAEVVSPILRYEDMAELQEIVRAVRGAGAKVDGSTGIHIHVDAAPFDAKKLANLVKIINKQEALIERALGIADSRKARWCKGVRQDFLQKIEREKPKTLEALNTAWYGHYNPRPHHYHGSRYHGLNLHNVWFRGTVEFRWFNGTLHAGQVKAYRRDVRWANTSTGWSIKQLV